MEPKTNAQVALEAASHVYEGTPYHGGDTVNDVLRHADKYLRWLSENS